jgi:hypothetical protein
MARPAQFYEYLRPTEAKPNSLLPPQQRELLTSEWNDGRYAATSGALTWRRDVVPPKEGGDDDESGVMQAGRDFPLGVLTSEGEQIDLREKNSWSLHLDEVSTREFLEVQVRAILIIVIVIIITVLLTRQIKRGCRRSMRLRRSLSMDGCAG